MAQKSVDYALTTCPATRTVRVIGGRWKLIILYHLQRDVQRYSDLQRHLPGITPKMLTQQLRELEDDGIVHREIYRQVPPKVEYSLTPLGRSLIPVIDAISEWGRTHANAATSPSQDCGPGATGFSPAIPAA